MPEKCCNQCERKNNISSIFTKHVCFMLFIKDLFKQNYFVNAKLFFKPWIDKGCLYIQVLICKCLFANYMHKGGSQNPVNSTLPMYHIVHVVYNQNVH